MSVIDRHVTESPLALGMGRHFQTCSLGTASLYPVNSERKGWSLQAVCLRAGRSPSRSPSPGGPPWGGHVERVEPAAGQAEWVCGKNSPGASPWLHEAQCAWKGASLLAQGQRTHLPKQETWVPSWVGKLPWRRAQQPTPVFLPGDSHRQKSLAGYSQVTKEADTT